MFSLFRKSKGPDVRDVEQVIFDVAERQSDEDLQVLYQLMKDRNVCVPVDTATIPVTAEPGRPYRVEQSDRLAMRYVTGPNNVLLVPVATREDSPILKGGYAYMHWIEALSMVGKLDPKFWGLLLQGKTSWVVMDRERIKYILELYGA
jgi:hypothetical protein